VTIPAETQTEENRITTDFSKFVNIKYANKGRKLIYRPVSIILFRKPKQAKQYKRPALRGEGLSQFQSLFNWNLLQVARKLV